MSALVYKDIWIRWVHSSWAERGEWLSDIPSSILFAPEFKTVQFIFDDHTCMFVPIDELQDALRGKTPDEHGMIRFNIDPYSRTVDGVPVKGIAFMQSIATSRNNEAGLSDPSN